MGCKRGGTETQREVRETGVRARKRPYGGTERQARDERMGRALGRLAFTASITAEQYAAGQKYAEIYHRHHAVMGWPLPFPASVTALLASDGVLGGVGAPPSRELIEKVRRHYGAVLDVLGQSDRDRQDALGKAPSVLAYRLVCLDACDRGVVSQGGDEGVCLSGGHAEGNPFQSVG